LPGSEEDHVFGLHLDDHGRERDDGDDDIDNDDDNNEKRFVRSDNYFRRIYMYGHGPGNVHICMCVHGVLIHMYIYAKTIVEWC